MKLRVVKLGGSLLARRDWPQRLRDWLSANTEASTLVVVGGGELVESIRELDAVHNLSAEFVHWLCIDLLAHTAQIVNQLLPELARIETQAELQQWCLRTENECHAQVALATVTAFYNRATHDERLPKSWLTTSDSLAALLAKQIGASELVLLKSTEAKTDSKMTSAEELASLGIVDEAFTGIVASSLPFRIINLAELAG